MDIIVTKNMVKQAFSNVDKKLAIGDQKKKVYLPNANADQYYINNIIGELGELVFAKAVIQHGYKLGVDSNSFDSFMRSDVCDFFTSKTGNTIDVKTINHKSNNLIINKGISHWRRVYNYVLVKLINDEKINNPMEIYKIKKAKVLGSLTFGTISRSSNLRTMYGKEVYFINKDRLSPIHHLIESHFYKKDEKRNRYYSEGILKMDLASIEHGAVKECVDNVEINELASKYKNTGQERGHYNFIPRFIGSSKVVSFSIYKGQFNTVLFFKALMEAEVKARKLKLTLVIPDYIESYVPADDKEKLIEIINNLNCNVQYVWSHNREYQLI